MPKPFNLQEVPVPDLNWSLFVSEIAQANAALAKYDGLLESVPNPSVLLSPLMTQEAVLSSKIEGTQATLQQVLEFEADPKAPNSRYDDIQEIINYRRALTYAERYLPKKPFGLNLLREMHGILMNGVRGKDKGRGQFRTDQNWIGRDGCKIEEAKYVPPAPHAVMPLLSNWEKYFHFDERERLVQLSIIHAQFELIHPFSDGNGRIGRLMIPIFLSETKLLSRPMFYLSSYLESTHKEYYFRLLRISEADDWVGWIQYFLSAIKSQALHNIEQAKQILQLYEEMKETVDSLTRSRFAIRTVDFLFSEPIFNSSEFVTRSRIPRASALRLLGCLRESKIVRVVREGKGRKAGIFAFEKLLKIAST